METIGRYNLIAELGRGATGTVFKAHDGHLNRLVAIKVLTYASSSAKEQSRIAEMFSREARTVARLVHPGIVQVYDVFDDEKTGSPCIVMEFVAGGTLASQLPAGQPLPMDRVFSLSLQISETLDYAHKNCFLHLDLKPANILVTEEGKTKIADFGLARFQGRVGALSTVSIQGTPAYLAPERISGATADARSDIFSLGIILYQMLTGRLPFDGDTPSLLYAILNEQPARPSSLNVVLPAEFDTLIARMIEKDPARRLSSAGEFAKALQKLEKPRLLETLVAPTPLLAVAPSSNGANMAERPQPPMLRPNEKPRPHGVIRKTVPPSAHRRWTLPSLAGISPSTARLMEGTGLLVLSLTLGGMAWLGTVPGRGQTTSLPEPRPMQASLNIEPSSVKTGNSISGNAPDSTGGSLHGDRPATSLHPPVNSAAANAGNPAQTPAPLRRVKPAPVRFVCNYDLREGTLAVLLDGKVVFRETVKAKKQAFLGLTRDYRGRISRIILVPANTSNISVEVSSADRSLQLQDFVTSEGLKDGRSTLRASIESGTLRLNWDALKPVAADPSKR